MPDQVVDTLDLLATCLTVIPAALVHWHKAYTGHLQQSAQLLQYLDSNWGRFKQGLDVPEFHEIIEAFEDYNQSVIKFNSIFLLINKAVLVTLEAFPLALSIKFLRYKYLEPLIF